MNNEEFKRALELEIKAKVKYCEDLEPHYYIEMLSDEEQEEYWSLAKS